MNKEERAVMNGADIIVDFLVRQKVPYLFGLCGHGNVGFLDAAFKAQDKIRTISVHHEQTAGHMADAYFKVRHEPVATFTSCGPGSANLVMALAAWFHKASWERMGNPLFLIPPAIATLIPVLLILKEPNLGTAVITGLVGFSVFLAAGVRWWKMLLVVAPIPFAIRIGYGYLHDYQRARIDTFLHPESDPLGAGYNIIQSKIALGSGGMWGKGFLQGTQAHLDFLPEKQTDFIFTIIGEEFGFVGGLAVMVLLGLIIIGGMLIALRCRHQFGRLVALGISCNFFLYVFVNIAMVMGVIPVGGVPLPLVSHGGSAMLTVMVGFGVLMSVHVHRDVEFPRARDDR